MKHFEFGNRIKYKNKTFKVIKCTYKLLMYNEENAQIEIIEFIEDELKNIIAIE